MNLGITGILICIAWAIDMFLFVPVYTHKKYDHSSRTNKLIFKGICIGIPLVVMIIGMVKELVTPTGRPFIVIMTVGMMLCAVGDIVLEIKFFRGGCLFLAGHLVYVAGLYVMLEKITVVTVIIYLLLAVIGTVLTLDLLGKKYRLPLVSYNLVISGSFALGVSLISTQEPANMLVGIGACFLVISDWLLGRNKLVGSNFRRSLISLIFYFGGQILISTIALFS